MSFLDSNVPEINVPVMEPAQHVRVPTQATVTETSSKMTSWYDWLVNHVPGPIKRNVSSTFNTMKEKIVTLYNSPVMKPTRYVRKPVRENVAKVNNEMGGWQDWLVSHVPEPIRDSASSAFRTMKENILHLYEEPFEVTKIRSNSNARFTTYFDTYTIKINRPPVDAVDVFQKALNMTINERGLVVGDKIRLIVSHP